MPRVDPPSAGRLGLVQRLVRLQRVSKDICWRCKVNCSDIPWTVTSTAAARRTSRYRTSDLLARQTEQGISVNPLFSLPGFPAELICIDVLQSMDLGATQDATGICFFDLAASESGAQVVFNFLYVCLHLLVSVFVCLSVYRVHVQSCLVSPGGLGPSARSRGAAGLLSRGTRSDFTTRRSTRNAGCRN